ncbi:MAG: hypothetical protein HYV24_10885 [Deltaproteobacteria bacterium]|nr:hypothetical protein [Deltaproteobacteria bacterium]
MRRALSIRGKPGRGVAALLLALALSGYLASGGFAGEGAEEFTETASILKDPVSFEGREVLLKGRFRGWKARCAGSSPATRSDWALEDDTACIYVSGRVPRGLSSLKPKGELVIVKGIARAGKKGAYIEAKEARRPPLARK